MKAKSSFVAKNERNASPTGCSAKKLRQLSRRVSQQFDAIIGNAGLKTTQYSLLVQVMALGPIRPGELARVMEMDASTLTRNLQPLVAHEWVRVGAGEDGRSRQVSITDLGREKCTQTRHEWKRAQSAFNEMMGEDLVCRLHAVIDECLEIMNESQGGADAEDVSV